MTPLESALSYAQRGWSVFPCHSVTVAGTCTCGKPDCTNQGKHPRTMNGVKDATTDPARITEWFQLMPDSNIALACGADSDLLVVDIDPRHGGYESLLEYELSRPEGPLPSTLTGISGGGGKHLFYHYPQGLNIGNRNGWLPGVDIKSNGGYVIAPPSIHVSGMKYRWLNEEPIVDAPADFLEHITAAGAVGGRSDLPATGDILKGIPEGKRDDVLFRAACRWRRQLKDKEAVLTLVLEAAKRCDPPFPDDDARIKVEQAFKQNHDDDDDDDDVAIPSDDEGRHLSDHGNAQRLIDAYGDELAYVQSWGWMIWDGTRWRNDTLDAVVAKARDTVQSIYSEAMAAGSKDRRKRVAKWAHDSESAGRIAAMVQLAHSDERVARSVEIFDADPWLLTCRNGTIDLRTGELHPHSRDDYATRYTNVEYDPTYKFEQWDEFLFDTACGDQELMHYLQMAVGYTLTGDTREECLFLIHGPAASGKSTFMDAVQTAMGEHAMVTQAETFLNRKGQAPPGHEIARFFGARMVATVEVPEGERFAEALVKQLTGGDKVVGRQLYKTGFEYIPTFKLWFATNHAPRIMDDAIWRRIKKIPFTNAVPPERRNPTLKKNLRDTERGGKRVLAWAVQGCMDWIQAGGLVTPKSVLKETQEYKQDQDKFAGFLEEHCVMGEAATVRKDDLYTRYSSWCMANGERPMTSSSLTTKLRSREDIHHFDVKRRSDGQWYTGIELKEPIWSSQIPSPAEQAQFASRL